MKVIHIVSVLLLIVGGLNWLLVAFGYNAVDMVFGVGSTISAIVYFLVGLSAILEIFTHKKNCRMCTTA